MEAAQAPTLNMYATHVAKSTTVVSVGGRPWECRNRILRPLSLPHDFHRVDRLAVRRVLTRTRAVMAEWSEGWDMPPTSWWHVCCDDAEYDVSRLRQGPRYEIRQGLKKSEVRMLDPIWFAENGYGVFRAAHRHYGTPSPLTEEEFVRLFTSHAEYPGRETWGAFVGSTLVAWDSFLVIGDAVKSSSAKSDPVSFKAHANNALVYITTQHYLRERGLRYVTSGARTLLHPTKTQDFRERMGYRKVYSVLCTEVSRLGSFIAFTRPQTVARRVGLGSVIGNRADQLDAFVAAVDLSREHNKLLELDR